VQILEVEGDLLDQDVDAIVNAWNRNVIPWWLLLPQGVSGAIKRRAGTAPFREVSRHGLLQLGHAVATSAGRLPHRAIIHVAGINLLWTATEASIRASVRSAMTLATQRGFTSVAFPAIGSGSGHFNETRALDLIRIELAQIPFEGRVVLVRYAKKRHPPP
jgi:O-acetyl-ADP-ribose deacetylase (regulator of RNase III)